MKSFYIHFIRHGICDGNLEGKYIGRTQSPLSDVGMKELIDFKQRYEYPRATHFYASPSTRCVDSLRILYPEAQPQVILEFAEVDFGDWENKTPQELENEPNFKEWASRTPGITPPNGENSTAFVHRVCQGFEMLVQNMFMTKQEHVVVVAHAGVIMTILSAFGYPKAKATDWMMPSSQGYTVRLDASNWAKSRFCEVIQRVPVSNEENEASLNAARAVADEMQEEGEDE